MKSRVDSPSETDLATDERFRKLSAAQSGGGHVGTVKFVFADGRVEVTSGLNSERVTHASDLSSVAAHFRVAPPLKLGERLDAMTKEFRAEVLEAR